MSFNNESHFHSGTKRGRREPQCLWLDFRTQEQDNYLFIRGGVKALPALPRLTELHPAQLSRWLSEPHAQHRREPLELAQAALASTENWRAQPRRRFSCSTLGGPMEITVSTAWFWQQKLPQYRRSSDSGPPKTRKFQTATQTVAGLLDWATNSLSPQASARGLNDGGIEQPRLQPFTAPGLPEPWAKTLL